MADERQIAKCPRCDSNSLDDGTMAMDVKWFRSKQWVSFGWTFQASVCLDCGFLIQQLSPSDLQKLREKNA